MEVVDVCVRQDGTSFLADQLNPYERDWVKKIERVDPKRSMSISYNIIDNTNINDNWNILSVYSFDNPLREGIPELMENTIKRNLRPCILTGDGREAAEEVGKRCGLITDNIYRILDDMCLQRVLNDLDKNQNQVGNYSLLH